MGNISALTTIDSVVKNLQWYSDIGDTNYHKLLGLVGRGLINLKRFSGGQSVERVVKNLDSLTNGVMSYPDDALSVVNVYYNEGNTLYPIPHKNDIIYKENDSGVIEEVKERNDNYYQNFATPGGRGIYYYKDDVSNRRLIFDTTADIDVFVYYISTGIDKDAGEDTLIPLNYQDYLEMWVLWTWNKLRGKGNMANYYYEEFKRASKMLKAESMPSLNEIQEAIYSTYSQGAKR